MKILVVIFSIALCLSCSDDIAPKLIEKPHATPEKTDNHKDITLTFKPEVDILFVVDNSGSMTNHQTNLSSNVGSFTSNITTNTLLDYHIGVTTSDMDDERGKLFHQPGSPKWVDKSTPDRTFHLSANLQPGTWGSADERFFEPVISAFSSPVVNGYNDGFYRDEAFLAIIFITDSIDNGPLSADATWNFLLKLKNYQPEKIIAYAAFIPPGVDNCTRDPDGEPHKILDFLENKVEKLNPQKPNYFNLCSPDFGSELARIGEDLENRIDLFVPMYEFPVISTIKVTFGKQVIPNVSEVGGDVEKGWSYDQQRAGIRLGRQIDIKDQPGASLSITYIPANLDE